ncbi:exosortase-associated protein EpsI, B-type [Janthinobacterium aquaticum]|uniref:exosortase-associated protein EpsI, B-type n=1 Tax=Janthinobacterium sp. FT58W TaxID=2654254 RepID=UPI0012646D4F|nr:exosortase-associated protein EpsI, B-type [Janthinobacterium sp. FT58W]KAB8041451.1 EpsI family protein [Janthinobacterium sp. FT58W]
MNAALRTNLLLGALMLGAAILSRGVAPNVKMSDQRPAFSLETAIPQSFGEWRVDTSIVPLQVDPDTQSRLNKIYNQTLARTYINRSGERVMLSIAYGGDQSDNMSVHKPEVCYAAQGFRVDRDEYGELATRYGQLPVKRLLAVAGNRSEPITYWITVGNKISKVGLQQRLEQLRYGLTGTLADAMLFRVSSIDTDLPHSYQLQANFVNTLLANMGPAERSRLIGAPPG